MENLKIKTFVNGPESGSNVGYGMITFNDLLTVKFSLRKSGKGNVFVSWPQYQNTKKEWTSYITFDDQDGKKDVENAIIDSFNKELGLKTGGETKKKETPKSDDTQSSETESGKKREKRVNWR